MDVTGTRSRPFKAVFEQGWHYIAIPVGVAIVGLLWAELALRHFERVEAHARRGIVGYHYSTPEWGFEYRPNGPAIEKWAFNMPWTVTLGALAVSAALVSWRRRAQLGTWGMIGLCVVHFFAAVAFITLTALIWVEAADVFI